MEKILKKLPLLLFVLMCSIALSSCDEEEPDKLKTGNIVGTWVSVEYENYGTPTQITTTYTISFSNNGTGYRSVSEKMATGAEDLSKYTFHYTVATASNGVMTITVIDDDDNYTQTWTASQTGKTLLVGTRVYTKK